MPGPHLPSPLQAVDDDRAKAHGVELLLKRDDLTHPALPGNKWRKLVPNLDAARRQGARRLLTFGGAWSNHIAATAAAGPLWGFDTVGVIRGEEHLPLNPVLASAVRNGMQLVYMDRGTYRRKTEPEVLDQLRREHGNVHLIPEGGSNALAVRSCRTISEEIGPSVDVVCCAVGTGGTLAGIAAGLAPHQEAVGFSALKGGDFLTGEVEGLQHAAFGGPVGRWRIETDYHFGGFAKSTPELDAFIGDFDDRHSIRLEWVYVAKMMAGLFDLIEQGHFSPGTRIAAVITGPPGP
jgi:1-aminocyclopropane-1-carboxylate deaminase